MFALCFFNLSHACCTEYVLVLRMNRLQAGREAPQSGRWNAGSEAHPEPHPKAQPEPHPKNHPATFSANARDFSLVSE